MARNGSKTAIYFVIFISKQSLLIYQRDFQPTVKDKVTKIKALEWNLQYFACKSYCLFTFSGRVHLSNFQERKLYSKLLIYRSLISL